MSVITLTSDGSQVHYSKGVGRAAATPTGAITQRKYFCEDGSCILLSKDGWIDYDDGAGTRRVISATDLRWHNFADREGWYAYAPAPPAPVFASSALTKHGRHDSAYSGGNTSGAKKDREDERSSSEAEEDDYDDMYRYRGMMKSK